jgi:hypothetical protein
VKQPERKRILETLCKKWRCCNLRGVSRVICLCSCCRSNCGQSNPRQNILVVPNHMINGKEPLNCGTGGCDGKTDTACRSEVLGQGRGYERNIRRFWVKGRGQARVCSRSIAGIAGSNPAGSRISVSCECCVLSGRGFCVGLITRPEAFYRMWCVWVRSWRLDREGHDPNTGRSAIEDREKERVSEGTVHRSPTVSSTVHGVTSQKTTPIQSAVRNLNATQNWTIFIVTQNCCTVTLWYSNTAVQ